MNKNLSTPSCYFEYAEKSDEVQKDGIYIIGFEFDGTACFRKGAVLGPDAIRNVAFGIEDYSPYLDRSLEEFKNLYDLGNLNLGDSSEAESRWHRGNSSFDSLFKDKQGKNIKIVTLGGEHSVSYAPIKYHLNKYSNLVLLHLDAHADLRDGYEGYHYSHASIIRRSVDLFKKDHMLVQYGIRSGTREEYQWMKDHDTLSCSREDLINKISSIDNLRPIYLTFDLDFFDPGYFPGTGTPEAGGEDFHFFIKLVKLLKMKNLVGFDLVELAPNLDTSGNSSVFAVKVLRELLLCLREEK